MDSQEDTEPRKFFSFHGSITKINGKELEVQTQELMGGSVPRATYKFLAEGEETSYGRVTFFVIIIIIIVCVCVLE